jgi:cytochrome c peroxidase
MNIISRKPRVLAICLVLVLTACNADDKPQPLPEEQLDKLDIALNALIKTHGLTGNHFSDRVIPDVNSNIVQLGKHLFFSKSLGGNRDSACVSCHHPMLGGGDNLSLPIGVDAQLPDLLGLGREHDVNSPTYDGGPTVPRNAPTTFNIGGWDQFIFHDGRVESIGKTTGKNGHDGVGIRTPDSSFGIADPKAGSSLTQAQARFPVTSNEEMKGFNHLTKNNQEMRDYLAGRLGGFSEAETELSDHSFWLDKFKEAFQQPNANSEQLITEQNISFAIAQYELSQVFSATPWLHYIEGDTSALTDSAKRGAILFYQSEEQGGANCAFCHSGDFFTDEKFHNVAAPQLGNGKGDGNSGHEDFGRFRETNLERDMFAFRTPSLLNVVNTGPWMHSGAYVELIDVVKHSVNAKQSIESYHNIVLNQPGIQNLDTASIFAQKAMESDNFEGGMLEVNEQDIADLVGFLHALSDPCVTDRECMMPWLLMDDEGQDSNGDQIIAIDQHGDEL